MCSFFLLFLVLQPGDYGKVRTWASVAWIIFAPIAGLVNERYGMVISTIIYCIGSVLAVPSGWSLPLESLKTRGRGRDRGEKEDQVHRTEAIPPPTSAPRRTRATTSTQNELEQPLLDEESPLTPMSALTGAAGDRERRPELSKALAMVRFIEAITELGAVPPPGSIYGFAEVVTPAYAAGHFRNREFGWKEGIPDNKDLFEEGGILNKIEPSNVEERMHDMEAGESSQRLERKRGEEGGEVKGPTVAKSSHLQEGDNAVNASPFSNNNVVVTPPPSLPGLPRLKVSKSEPDVATERPQDLQEEQQQRRSFVIHPPPQRMQPRVDLGFKTLAETLHGPRIVDRSSSIVLPRGGISRAVSAGDLLRSVRDIQAYRPTAETSRQSSGVSSEREKEKKEEKEEEPFSPSPNTIRGEEYGQLSIAAMSSGELVDILDGGSSNEEESSDYPIPRYIDRLTPEESTTQQGGEEAPSERVSALQRLVQIFNPWRSGSFIAATATEITEEEETPPATPHSTRSSTPQPHSLLTGFTPIRNYIESRRQRLVNLSRQQQQNNNNDNMLQDEEFLLEATTTTTAAQQHSTLFGEPSLATPLPESTSAGDGVLQNSAVPMSTSLLPTLNTNTTCPPGAQIPIYEHDMPAVLRAGISEELMREALDMEAAEVAGHDPTGRLVVDVLSKKLARMAEEAARRKRRQARKQREKQQKLMVAQRERLGGPPEIPGIAGREPRAAAAEPDHGQNNEIEFDGDTSSANSHLTFKVLFKTPSVLSFFVIATLLGFGHGLIGTYLFMYLKHLGAKESLMGAVLLANALPELPVFWMFGSILKKVGMDTLLVVSTITLGLRIAAYSVFSIWKVGVHWVLLLETSHAITYACGWSACALNASKIAPPLLESTTQAVFQGLWSGIGAGMGGLLGGVLYHWKGPETLFLYAGGIIFGIGGIAGVVLGVQHKRRRYKRTHDSSAALSSMVL